MRFFFDAVGLCGDGSVCIGKKVSEHLLAVRREDGFGMKLYAEHGICFVLHGHDLAVIGLCGDAQAVRHGRVIGSEGVIPGNPHALRQSAKERAVLLHRDL